MRISRITICVLIFIIVLSVFVAKISNLITVNYDNNPNPSRSSSSEQNDEGGGSEKEKLGSHLSSSSVLSEPSITIQDKMDHVFWFIQITDIHLSMFHDPGRIRDFKIFVNTTLDTIKPTVVLASGDLADAKAIDNMGSNQYEQEWQYYNDILEENKVVEKTMWLDVRGNHDNFNVPSVFSEQNYYHRYSIQGKRHLRSYMYTIEKGVDKYSFIAVDACLDPGPRRPFNFFGRVSPEQFQMLEKFEKDSRQSNATVWFGHYPTSCIVSQGSLRQLMSSGVAYMCGHLHTLGGLIPGMYTLQKTGALELELGDWKDSRLFRLAAFDHGLFSFTDVHHGKWPVILVTNPKNALFVLPNKEPLEAIKKSTHIRILIFSPNPLEIVRVKINLEDSRECQNINGPLFVCKWDPNLYKTGIHQLEVYARDTSGQSNNQIQPFSLDGTRLSFSFLPRLVLMTDARDVFFFGFIALVVIATLPLIVLRVLHNLVRDKKMAFPEFRRFQCIGIIRRFWMLATVNKLLYPLIFYPLYITIGPWLIGEVIEGHLGVSFAWGTFVAGKYIPGAFTYFYGLIQMFWFHIPLLFIITHCVDFRFKQLYMNKRQSKISSIFCQHLPCVLILTLQALFAFYFWQAYGTIALILGPFRTWSVLLGIYLWYFSSTLTRKDLQEAKLLWGNKEISTDGGENRNF